jgi:TonB family protein
MDTRTIIPFFYLLNYGYFMKIYLALLCLCVSLVCAGQNQNAGQKVTTTPAPVETVNELPALPSDSKVPDQMPISDYNMNEFLSTNIKYPAEAVQNKIEGVVYMNFQVGPDGEVRDVQITKGIGYGCDEEARRVITLFPKWQPGKRDGKPVPVRCVVPVRFRLAQNQNAGQIVTTTPAPVDTVVQLPPLPNEFTIVEQMPYSDYEYGKYFATNLKYPDEALKNKIEGVVYVNFQVGPQGEIRDVQVAKGIGAGCDQEAVRVITQMPKWVPGKQGGKVVPVRCVIPVRFRLATK